MPTWFTQKNSKILLAVSVAIVCVLGTVFRFYNITASEFFFYDEGYYLNHDRSSLQLIASHFPKTLYEFWQIMYFYLCLALRTGKALWFFVTNLRVFFGGENLWFFPRLVAALAGTATLFVVYHFAKRFFRSPLVAWLSVIILAVFPSHVFYSRLGLQESLCTLLFRAGFYFYLFPAQFGRRTFISAIFFSLAYFSNYRLIILPVFVLFCEIFTSFSLKKIPDARKYIWNTLIFLLAVFLVGSINHGQNTIVTFAWMFHQAGLAETTFDPFNFFSYPYYLFKLDNMFFGILFFANAYFLVKREWLKSFPFALTILGMAIFSLTADKAARYICVMLPFAAMAVAGMVDFLLCEIKPAFFRRGTVALTILMLCAMTGQSFEVARFKSDQEASVKYIKALDPEARIMSTQMWIENLYMNPKNIIECPKHLPSFVREYNQGFKYIVIDPQMYVSWAEANRRFVPVMGNYLQFIVFKVKPLKTFSHFNDKMLERFVFEHNENLRRSIAFLKSNNGDLGALRIYNAKDCIVTIAAVMTAQAKRSR